MSGINFIHTKEIIMVNLQKNNLHPRAYLSWSQLSLFERSPARYKEVYLYGAKTPDNAGMAFGRQMAEGLENEEATGDPILDLLMAQLPKFEIMDKPITAELKNGKKIIPLLAKPDSMKADMTGFLEYKTGQQKWSKTKVDQSGQITFYATVMYLKTGKIPHDIELVQVMTAKGTNEPLDAEFGAYEGVEIRATGEIRRIKTSRSIGQILNMMIKMKKAWQSINELCENELF